MTKTRRIVLNTFATYGRSVFALVVGVFSSRWLLQGLGAQDLGLQSVVGSLISAIIIFETVMQVAVARFYAYAIGKAQKMSVEDGADEICRWFNVVFLIHTVLPVFVTVVGYPLGLYAVENWLTIPPERVDACIYVFRCSIVTTFISMVSVPYIAMYRAHQEIVELSIFGMLRSIINFVFAFSILYVTGDRLKYSGTFGAGVTLSILGIQMCRAWYQFPECRVRCMYLFDFERIRKIFCYFFWEIFSCTGDMTRQQGSAIVLNKYFGPSTNAAWSIANALSSQATALSGALTGAIIPAVTTEEGAGERNKMIDMSFRTCKFGTILILLFSIPLIAEMDEVLKLWLVKPPPNTMKLCSCILVAYAIDKLGLGHHVAISANGRIGLYHSVVGTTFCLSIPIAITLVCLGFGPESVGYMFIISFSLVSIERIVFARYLVGMPIRRYVKSTIVPIGMLSFSAYFAAYVITCTLMPSFIRICITTVVSLSVMGLVGWIGVLDNDERLYLKKSISHVYLRLWHK